MRATEQRWWWSALRCRGTHIPPCLSSEQTPGDPQAQAGPHSSGCSTEGSAVPANLSPEEAKLELARGTQPALARNHGSCPSQREAGRAPGSPEKGLHCLMSTRASTVGLVISTLAGSSITSMQHSTVPHVNPREGRQQRCCGLVMQTPREGPRRGGGFAPGRDGGQRRWDMQLKGAMLKNEKNHPCL